MTLHISSIQLCQYTNLPPYPRTSCLTHFFLSTMEATDVVSERFNLTNTKDKRLIQLYLKNPLIDKIRFKHLDAPNNIYEITKGHSFPHNKQPPLLKMNDDIADAFSASNLTSFEITDQHGVKKFVTKV